MFAESITKRLVTRPAPDFQLETVDGRRVKLTDLRGRVVLLNFWATTCGPCRSEIPHLVKLYEKYRNQGVEILAITTDEKIDRHKVAPFAQQYGMTFPVLYDEAVAGAYGVNGIPMTVFIDAAGSRRHQTTGFGAGTGREQEVVLGELLSQKAK